MTVSKIESSALRSYSALAVSQLMLGMAGIFATLALTGAGAVEIIMLRLAIAAPIVLIAAKLRGALIRVTRRELIAMAIAGGCLGIHFVLWIEALRFIPVAIGTLLVCSTPFWLAAYDACVLRIRISSRALCAMTGAFLSLIVVTLSAPATPGTSPAAAIAGALLAAVAAVFVGIYLVLIRNVQRKYRTLTVVSYTYPAALCAVVPIEFFLRDPLPATTLSWGGVLLIAFCTHIIGHTALSASLRYFSATTVAFVGLLDPLIAAVAAAVLLGQSFGLVTGLGAAALLVSIAAVLATQTRQRENVVALVTEPPI